MKERFQNSASQKKLAKPSTNATSIYERAQQNLNSVQCPYCNRKFSEKAGTRHIAYCKEKAELLKFKESTPKTKIQKPTPAINQDVVSQKS